MVHMAEGNFDIDMQLQPSAVDGIERFVVKKTFHGALEGTGHGEMLAVRTAVEGSAAYVLIERITGRMAGRWGSFLLRHDGLMDRQAPTQNIVVIPDSGTDGLEGLSGTMTIDAEAKHRYAFRYSCPE
ncbi:hypothetical protein AA101099_2814 [Neoasaia chiangmaiensis NBRC 101099]|uniref:Uncharacterized protein n=2 Tax=Neoasaia chiangmaiensis TaxID=320497 RepID=A0A1U9KP99_9PROT|nr:DUF3224 domain-containing protein [Neoasaia chiangmaiensis]AQS87559.1 hypothetical protein A0U93_05980 [Neoasaia chiangmaiensis]GBR42268.1 hypothetical protein AA101099_2814 [Neoasaia chiangmaiensis NBRC 101099]GEN14108.1 hypothetical protein NCH01_05390 [Neoasaia chiangmaiensis]